MTGLSIFEKIIDHCKRDDVQEIRQILNSRDEEHISRLQNEISRLQNENAHLKNQYDENLLLQNENLRLQNEILRLQHELNETNRNSFWSSFFSRV